MLELAVADAPALSVEPAELDRPGPSYTVDTLRASAPASPSASWTLLLGADAARDLPAWHESAEIPRLARVVVFARPGSAVPSYPRSPAPSRSLRIDISATDIRRRVREGRSIRYWVPDRRRGVRALAPLIFGPRMIKNLMTAVFGTRFDRERKRIQPVRRRYSRPGGAAQGPERGELKAQTARFRQRLEERTGALKAELEEVREAKHGCADPEERDGLERRFHELESSTRRSWRRAWTTFSPRPSPPFARPAAGCSAPRSR